MAYRAPRYSYVHAARDVGADAITIHGSETADPDFPLDNLIDDRAGTLFKFSQSYVSPIIVIDLGAGPGTTGLDRVIIPANHNITSFRVIEDDAADMGGFNILLANTDTTPGTLIAETMTSSAKQYIGVQMNTTDLFYMPQLILSKIVTLDVGPALEDSPDGKIDNVTRLERNSGQSPTIQHGPQQRVIEYEYESPLEGADLTAMEALVDSVGMVRPFFVDPASFSATPEDDEPALWMKFAEMPQSRNSILVPMNGARSKTYRLQLIESLD